MDYIKTEMYIHASNLLMSGRCTFICDALEVAFMEQFIDPSGYYDTPSQFLQEFFPEFLEYYDNKFWDSNTKHYISNEIHGAWWSYELLEPRICLINTILEHHHA